MLTQEEGNKLWDDFLKHWSINALENMNLESYCSLGDKECFTYWVERGLEKIGSIRGGSSHKFGIYRRSNKDIKEDTNKLCYTDNYSWYKKFGNTEDEAFDKVHSIIVKIANLSRNGKFEDIEKIDLSPAYKWKIAALYQDRKNPTITNVFKQSNLQAFLEIDKKLSYVEMYRQIRAKHPDMPILDLGKLVWEKSNYNQNSESDAQDDSDFNESSPQNIPLNQIFYGPPGTGKTYNTINTALEIIDPEFIINSNGNRSEIKTRFDQLLSEKRIGFITFHQSFSYEDFVEGLKPEPDENGTLTYPVADGLFKTMSNLASSRIEKETNNEVNPEKRQIWKMSLGNTLGDDSYVYDECIENDYVLLGYGGDIDFSTCSDRLSIIEMFNSAGHEVKNSSYDVTSIHTFKNKISVGDLIIISDGNSKYRAIAEVTGDYQSLKDDDRNDYFQCRPVQWLKTYTPSRPREEIFKKAISQMSLYELRHKTLNMENLSNILSPKVTKSAEKPPYVLIIDEINRGNTASIFGELITLIEPSKRADAEEALRVILPYSKESFSVPNNLYIIGTMNTADRSLSLMDSALRRRFKFKEMMPDYSVLEGLKVEGIEIASMLEKMNQRIEALFDREHMLGHTFFLPLKQDSSITSLKSIFQDEIIPLMKEYFFEDWSKIQLVFGDNQKPEQFSIIVSNSQDGLFGEDENIAIPNTYRINIPALGATKSYFGIYKTLSDSD